MAGRRQNLVNHGLCHSGLSRGSFRLASWRGPGQCDTRRVATLPGARVPQFSPGDKFEPSSGACTGHVHTAASPTRAARVQHAAPGAAWRGQGLNIGVHWPPGRGMAADLPAICSPWAHAVGQPAPPHNARPEGSASRPGRSNIAGMVDSGRGYEGQGRRAAARQCCQDPQSAHAAGCICNGSGGHAQIVLHP